MAFVKSMFAIVKQSLGARRLAKPIPGPSVPLPVGIAVDVIVVGISIGIFAAVFPLLSFLLFFLRQQ